MSEQKNEQQNATSRRTFLTKAAGAALATALPVTAQEAAKPKAAVAGKSAAVVKRRSR